MESAARRTVRAHEHESCRAFARSAPPRRHAKHPGQARSRCSRADYEKSDRQCHARLLLQQHCKDRLSSKESTDMPHCVSYRFPLRTASTTSRIVSITSRGCSLCISWPLFVLVTCFSFGTSLASRSCAFFCATSTT